MTAQASDQRNRETVRQWLQGLERAEQSGFVPLLRLRELADGASVENESRLWAGRFLSPLASPYSKGTKVVRSTHAATSDTFDVLRHEYRALGKSLVLRETASFAALEIAGAGDDTLKLKPRDRPESIHQLVDLLLASTGTHIGRDMQEERYHWRFLFPEEIVDGCTFTTNPDANVTWLWSWAERADGSIRNGRVHFILHKQREATDGRIVVLNMRHWFDGKCWDPYRGPERG